MSLGRKALLGFLSFLLFASLFGMITTITAKKTVLDPDFVLTRLDSLEIAPLVQVFLKDQVPPEVTSVVPEAVIDDTIADVVTDLEPWLREQAEVAVHTGYDYLWGRRANLSFEIDLAPVKEDIKEAMRAIFYSSVPSAVLDMFPPAEVEDMFNQFADSFLSDFPPALTVDEGLLNGLDPSIMITLNTARHYLVYFQVLYIAFIVATALLIMGIILLSRRSVKYATRGTGIPCLVSGILGYAGTFLARHYAEGFIAQAEMPAGLGVWLRGFLTDALAPLRVAGIVLIAVGVALLIVSVAHRREADY